MTFISKKFAGVLATLVSSSVWLTAATSITQYGITWTFDKDYPTGQFCTGDYWVVGPVKVTKISTDLHAPGFSPKAGEDGSMVNPGTNDKQGYDNRLTNYEESLNAGLVGGEPVSASKPLILNGGSSLVSMVSWLFKSPTEKEPGTPSFDRTNTHPRPATRSGAVLTVLAKPAPSGSFRPPYVGTDKTVKFNFSQLNLSKLKKLEPVADTPDPAQLAKQMERPWIDHVYGWYGAMVHPSESMNNYGQHMAHVMNQVALVLHLDFSKLPGQPAKDKLLIELVQYGIDLAGIADNGGGWQSDGGHNMGRKWPILFAGEMLNDAHMKGVGQWKTRFHEDEQTFYVSKAEVDVTNSPQWTPDKRASLEPYETKDIGMPEWGIRHASKPDEDNRAWNATYRDINNSVNPGYVLAARIMGLQAAWNHNALFDYTDRSMKLTGGRNANGANHVHPFVINMWNAYNTVKNTDAVAPSAKAK